MHDGFRWIFRGSLWVTVAFFLSHCASAPVSEEVTEIEKIRRDRISGNRIAEGFEAKLDLIGNDPDLLVYLRGLAKKLADTHDQIRDAPIGAFVYKTKRKNSWKNYSLPGNRFYLSRPFLKEISFENELAAALALEMGHIIKRHTLGRLEVLRDQGILPKSVDDGSQLSDSDYFGVAGVFSFSEENILEAIPIALDILYSSGYDPRGLSRYWEMHDQNIAHSSYEKNSIKKYLDKTRDLISKKSPLRNPIVRTEEFIQIKKRISKL